MDTRKNVHATTTGKLRKVGPSAHEVVNLDKARMQPKICFCMTNKFLSIRDMLNTPLMMLK